MWMITSNLTGVVGKTAFDVWYFGFLMVERLLSCHRSWEGMCVYLRIAGHPKSSFYQYWILNIGLKVASSSLQLLQNKKQSYVSLPDLKKLRETPAQERILLKMFTGISPSTKNGKDYNLWTTVVHESGQIIATSQDLTPNGGLVREIPLFQGKLGWWNIIPFGQMNVNEKDGHLGKIVLPVSTTPPTGPHRRQVRLARPEDLEVFTGCMAP